MCDKCNEKSITDELADMDDFDAFESMGNKMAVDAGYTDTDHDGAPARPKFSEQDDRNLKSVGGTHSVVAGARFEEKCKDCRGTGKFYSYTGRYVGPCYKCKGKGVQVFKTSPEARKRQRVAAMDKKRKAVQAKAQAATKWLEENPERAAFLTQDWEFPVSLLGSLMQYGSLTEKQVAAIDRCIEKQAAKREANAKQDARGLDISGIPSGRYLVGDKHIKVDNITKAGRWQNWVFVKEADSESRLGSQRPDATYRGKYEAELAEIAKDPLAAAIAFGKETGQCCVCGRTLTNPDSIEAGIGPICASRF